MIGSFHISFLLFVLKFNFFIHTKTGVNQHRDLRLSQ